MQNARRRMSVGLKLIHIKNLNFGSAEQEPDSPLGFAFSNVQSLFNVLGLANSCHDI
jgi:hypothetical protein